MTHTTYRRHAWKALALLLPICIATTCNGDTEDDAALTSPAEPRARLRISGSMEGRLEPCGCASGQLGGLPRRAFYLRQDSSHDLLIEGGNVVAGGTPLDRAKFITTMEILGLQLEYGVLGIGPAELQIPIDELGMLAVLPTTAVSSDLQPAEGLEWPVQPYSEKPAGDATVRVASLTGAAPKGDLAASFQLLDPAAAWKRAMQGVAPETYRILLVHGDPDLARAQAALTPRPDLIVGVTAAFSEPPGGAETIDGVPVVFPGTRGRLILDVTLTRVDGKPQLTKYRPVALKASETAAGALEDKNAKGAIMAHRTAVQEEGIREQMAERMPTPNGATYVGSEACSDCHEEAYDIWKKSKHAHAWETLEKAEKGDRYGWPVTAYPDCVTCHVVGYGYKSGFVNPEKTAALKDVGCEQCHGPGSAHVASEGETKLEPSDVGTCLQCHDFEQSPDFREKYDERWEEIKHY